MKPRTLSAGGFGRCSKTTRRAAFLSGRGRMVSWSVPCALIVLAYAKARTGRSAAGLARMLRIRFLRSEFNLFDYAVAESGYINVLYERYSNTLDCAPVRQCCMAGRVGLTRQQQARPHIEALLPNNATQHHANPHGFDVLNTVAESALDAHTLMAAQIFRTPIALGSLRQWFKSIISLNATETSRDVAFCVYSILNPGGLRDAISDAGVLYRHPKTRSILEAACS